MEVLNHHAPVKMVKIRSNPFITLEIRQLMRKRDQWRKLTVKTIILFTGTDVFFRLEVEREILLYSRKCVRKGANPGP